LQQQQQQQQQQKGTTTTLTIFKQLVTLGDRSQIFYLKFYIHSLTGLQQTNTNDQMNKQTHNNSSDMGNAVFCSTIFIMTMFPKALAFHKYVWLLLAHDKNTTHAHNIQHIDSLHTHTHTHNSRGLARNRFITYLLSGILCFPTFSYNSISNHIHVD